MYDTITPEQWIIGLVISLLAFAGLVWLLWHYFPRDGQHAHMSTSSDAPAVPVQSANRSIDQSAPTSLHVQTSAPPPSGLAESGNAITPDMDAEQTGLDEWEMPRVSRYLNDNEFLTMLAAQKLRDGKWRLSANKIVAMVGGDRTHVLAVIRQVREPAPTFHPLTDEQQQLRAQLQLGER